MNGKHMRLTAVLAGMLFTLSCVTSQNRNDDQFQLAGRCEGCEAIFEYGDKSLSPVDILPVY